MQLSTLRTLFAEEIITKRTYVFAEHLSSEREWVRIERLPALLEALQQPPAEEQQLTPTEEPSTDLNREDSISKAPTNWTAPQRSRRTSEDGGGFEAVALAAAGAPSTAGASLDAQAPKVAHAPIVATPRVDVQLQPANISVRPRVASRACLTTGVLALCCLLRPPPRSAFDVLLLQCGVLRAGRNTRADPHVPED